MLKKIKKSDLPLQSSQLKVKGCCDPFTLFEYRTGKEITIDLFGCGVISSGGGGGGVVGSSKELTRLARKELSNS